MRCNCPHYNIPSADPNDSRGCPVHDPDYVNYETRYRELLADYNESVVEMDGEISTLKGYVKGLRHVVEELRAANGPVMTKVLQITAVTDTPDLLKAIGQLHVVDAHARISLERTVLSDA